MTHVITDACVKCKYTDCVDVCPVDCFHEGEHMLAINPDICIDCGICIDECPVEAIETESDENVKWLERARQNISRWPIIDNSKAPLPDADKFAQEENKYEKYIK